MSKTKKVYNENLKEIIENKRKEWSENLKDISPLIRSKDLHDMTEAQALALSYRTMLLDEIARYTPSELVINSMMGDCTDEINKIKERFENIYITHFNYI